MWNIQLETVMKSAKVNDVQQAVNWFEGDILSMVHSTASILEEFFIREVKKMRSLVFQQDGVPPHFAADVRRFLDKTFSGRCVRRWPNLTPLDFFLWERRLSLSMRTLAELKSRKSHKKFYLMFLVIFVKVCLSWWLATFSTCSKWVHMK